jgi:copper(I)-binding protein
MRTAILLPLAALACTLAGCGKTDKAPPVAAEPEVTEGKLVLPAVAGNPGAAYFSVKNNGAEPASLAGASVEGASKAELHETSAKSMAPLTTVTLGPGASAAFEPGGKHVMVFGVSKALKPGDTVKLTLFFSGGKTVTGPLQVAAAGGDMAGMAH